MGRAGFFFTLQPSFTGNSSVLRRPMAQFCCVVSSSSPFPHHLPKPLAKLLPNSFLGHTSRACPSARAELSIIRRKYESLRSWVQHEGLLSFPLLQGREEGNTTVQLDTQQAQPGAAVQWHRPTTLGRGMGGDGGGGRSFLSRTFSPSGSSLWGYRGEKQSWISSSFSPGLNFFPCPFLPSSRLMAQLCLQSPGCPFFFISANHWGFSESTNSCSLQTTLIWAQHFLISLLHRTPSIPSFQQVLITELPAQLMSWQRVTMGPCLCWRHAGPWRTGLAGCLSRRPGPTSQFDRASSTPHIQPRVPTMPSVSTDLLVAQEP